MKKKIFIILLITAFPLSLFPGDSSDYDIEYSADNMDELLRDTTYAYCPVYFMNYDVDRKKYSGIGYAGAGDFNKMLAEYFHSKYNENFASLKKDTTREDGKYIIELLTNLDRFNLSQVDTATKKSVRADLSTFSTGKLPEKFDRYSIIFVKGLEIESGRGVYGYMSVYVYNCKVNAIVYCHMFLYDPTRFSSSMGALFKHITDAL